MNKKTYRNTINIAIKKLYDGELIIFPTETVYGIGADATNSKAVKKIYITKNRPLNNPIISHFANIKILSKHVHLNSIALKLAEKYWPGPLTLILKKKQNSKISSLVSNQSKFIGCRIPNHELALEILNELNRPIAAPSANISTKLSTTDISHLDKSFKDKSIYTINDGQTELGLESTVIDLSSSTPKLLRYGSITEEEIKEIIPEIEINITNPKPLSPGQTYKHYSPNLPLRINVDNVNEGEVLLNFGLNNLKSKIFELNLSKKSNLKEAAKNFFMYLHILDKKKCKGIAVAPIPNFDLGKSINDRLNRAIKENF